MSLHFPGFPARRRRNKCAPLNGLQEKNQLSSWLFELLSTAKSLSSLTCGLKYSQKKSEKGLLLRFSLKGVEKMSFFIPRTTLYKGSLYRSSTTCQQWRRQPLNRSLLHHGHPLLKSNCRPCSFMLVFNILSILLIAYFDFYRLELKREPLNCPVDRNILIRDTVSDLLNCRLTSTEAGQERLLSLLNSI